MTLVKGCQESGNGWHQDAFTHLSADSESHYEETVNDPACQHSTSCTTVRKVHLGGRQQTDHRVHCITDQSFLRGKSH